MENKELRNIEYAIGHYNGEPITQTITVKEQKEIIKAGFNLKEFIDAMIQAGAEDWQQFC